MPAGTATDASNDQPVACRPSAKWDTRRDRNPEGFSSRSVRLLSYEQGVETIRVADGLSDSDRTMLMGGTLARIYG